MTKSDNLNNHCNILNTDS